MLKKVFRFAILATLLLGIFPAQAMQSYCAQANAIFEPVCCCADPLPQSEPTCCGEPIQEDKDTGCGCLHQSDEAESAPAILAQSNQDLLTPVLPEPNAVVDEFIVIRDPLERLQQATGPPGNFDKPSAPRAPPSVQTVI